jgi:uncharacterized delta-60 repeat protein
VKTAVTGTRVKRSSRAFAPLLALVIALVLGYVTVAHAAPGDPDTGFDGDGKVATDFAGAFNDSGLDVAVQEDGKAVVAGVVFRSGSGLDFAVTRLNADGTPDTSFDSDGQVVTPVGAGTSGDEAYGVAVRPDGKIVAAGFSSNSGANPDFAAVRYNPDGSLDTSFGTEGRVVTPVSGAAPDYAVDVAVQGTKTVLIGRTAKPSHNDFAAVRLNDNGSLDTGFDGDGIATLDFSSGSDDFGEDVAVDPDGKLVIAGHTGVSGNPATNDFAVARYNSDGSLDTTFGFGGKVTTHFGSGLDAAYAVVVGEDGRIVAGGKATNGPREGDYALARYKANGSLDDEFDFDGKVMTDFGGAGGWLWDLAMQDDGRVVAAGTSSAAGTGANMALARYNPDGSLNTSFGHDGKIMTDFFGFSDEARSVAVGEDGKIVAAGITSGSGTGMNFATARFFGGSDATPPKVAAPEKSLVANSALGAASAAPVRLSWSATDSEGEVTGYALQRSTDGGSYEAVSLPDEKTATITVPLAPDHNYRFRVRATDDNGNTSAWRYGQRFALDAHQENSSSIAYAKAWRSEASNVASGGGLRYTTVKGAKATLSFTGTDVAWVSPKTKTHGKAAVFLDGTKVATVDLFSRGTLSRQVVFSKGGLDPTVEHTLEVVALGTARHPRVDVDAFVVLR